MHTSIISPSWVLQWTGYDGDRGTNQQIPSNRMSESCTSWALIWVSLKWGTKIILQWKSYWNAWFRGYGNPLMITILTCHVHVATSKTIEDLTRFRDLLESHPNGGPNILNKPQSGALSGNCTKRQVSNFWSASAISRNAPFIFTCPWGLSWCFFILLVLLRALTFQGCSDPSKCLPCAQEPWKLQLLVLARTWPLGRRYEWLSGYKADVTQGIFREKRERERER